MHLSILIIAGRPQAEWMKTNGRGNDVREVKEEDIMKATGRCDFSLSMMGSHWKHLTKEWLGLSRLDKVTLATVWQIDGEGVGVAEE